MFAELERGRHAFSGICGWSPGANFNVEANGSVTASAVHSVTGNYYTVLGVSPLMGRLISLGDMQGNQISQVAVIGYELWQERFGGDPAVVGKNIRIDDKLFTIIGVTRKWFTGMIAGSPPEITIPAGAAQLYDLESRSLLWVFVTGRLNEGSGIEQARTQLQTFWPRLLEDTVPTQSIGPRRQSFLAMRFRIDPASAGSKNTDLRSKFLKPLYLLSGIVALILLVVCVNLASLTLARASARRHEISTRCWRQLRIISCLLFIRVLGFAANADSSIVNIVKLSPAAEVDDSATTGSELLPRRGCAVVEDLLEGNTEDVRDAEGDFERG
jgi:hypothetical protein